MTQTLRSTFSASNNVNNRNLTAVPDPYVYRSDGLTTTFFGFGIPVNAFLLYMVLDLAEYDRFGRSGADKMGTKIRDYHYVSFDDELSLVLVPSEKLTWDMWTSACSGTQAFDQEPDGWREFSFKINDDSSAGEEVGWGFLKEEYHTAATSSG